MTHFLTVFAREAKRRSNLPGGWVSVRHILFTLVVGYFANAQYDGEITDISLSLDMTCFFDTLPSELKIPGGDKTFACGFFLLYEVFAYPEEQHFFVNPLVFASGYFSF